MTSATVLTIRPSEHTAGTAQVVEVRPGHSEYVWVKVYDWENRDFKLMHVDASQMWFWTNKWQFLEHEVDEDLQHGRYEDFESMEDFINAL